MLESINGVSQGETTVPGIFRPATAAAKAITRSGGIYPPAILTTPSAETNPTNAITGQRSESGSGSGLGVGVGIQSESTLSTPSSPSPSPDPRSSLSPDTSTSRDTSTSPSPGALADEDDYLFGSPLPGTSSFTQPMSRRRALVRASTLSPTEPQSPSVPPPLSPSSQQSQASQPQPSQPQPSQPQPRQVQQQQQQRTEIGDNLFNNINNNRNNKGNNNYRTIEYRTSYNDVEEEEEEEEERVAPGRGRFSTEADDDDIPPPVELSPQEILRDKKHQRLSVQVEPDLSLAQPKPLSPLTQPDPSYRTNHTQHTHHQPTL